MKIEEYKPEHNLKKILFIDKQSIEDFYEEIKDVYSQSDLLDIKEHYNNRNGLMFIGLLDSEIIAMCGFLPSSNNTAKLMRLRVRKDMRGLGYGKQILSHVEMIIAARGYKSIRFSTASSRIDTLHFYRKRGYLEVDREMYGNIETTIFQKNCY